MLYRPRLFLFALLLLVAGCSDDAVLTETPQPSAEPPVTRAAPEAPAVLMQGFYWDSPNESGSGEWWDFVRAEVPTLADDGFTEIWLPPPSKAQNDPSMGYDPYDYFDLGEYDQKMGTETWFGSRTELETLISTAHSNDMDVIADIVVNHNSGGDLESNPNTGTETYTSFAPASGEYTFNYDNFHPSSYAESDRGTFAGFPDLAHANPGTYNVAEDFMQWLDDTVGFDGWRYDFVKGLNPGTVRSLQQSVDGFGVGEYFDGNKSRVLQWLDDTNYTVSAFDFPLHYSLKSMCNTTSGGYDLRNLWGSGILFDAPFNTVTFVSNHDTDKDAPIISDKMLGYAVVLTHEGKPSVFWKDYFNYGLAQRGEATGIAQLVWAYQNLADGGSSLLHESPDFYVMQRDGTPGLALALNDSPGGWDGQRVKTQWPNTKLHAYAWGGSVDQGQPQDKWTDENGYVTLYAAPRGYAVYAPAGY